MEHRADWKKRSRTGVRPASDPAGGPGEEPEEAEPRPHFTWLDILAMIIAAYQIIFPIVFLFIGVMVLVYFLFRWLFL
ncbi:MAG: hypothetical protein DIU70_004725 [Bacillota bacterium]|nr:MAG: hypothetical protein DIU70_05485 [Bacillota bacterium]